jgi:transposase
MAKSLRSHEQLLLNWFKAKKLYSSGVVEGLNNKIKTTTKKSYGFRTYNVLQVQLYHTLGELPLPKVTHRFC